MCCIIKVGSACRVMFHVNKLTTSVSLFYLERFPFEKEKNIIVNTLKII